MQTVENQNAVTTAKPNTSTRIGNAMAVGTVAAMPLLAHAEVDVAGGVAVIAGAAAAIAAVGAAKMIPAATIALWGYVKSAFSRT